MLFYRVGFPPILLHKPHPQKELKPYQVRQLLEMLEQEGVAMNNTMEYKGYIGSVEFSEEDGILYGKVMGIRALISYEGESGKELLLDFHEAVDDYLPLCEEKGMEPERAYKGSFNVRISPELHRKVALSAAEQKISLNSFVEKALLASVAVQSGL